MTTCPTQKHPSAARLSPGQILFGFLTLFCLVLILRNTEAAMGYIHNGLVLCAETVIPALFPFMVLSELLISGGFGNAMVRLVARPLKTLLGLSDTACCSILLGLLCGFPVGAKCAVSAYDNGRLSKRECECVIAASCIPSSAFLISAVGVSLWNDRRFGILLYLTVALTALLTGAVICRRNREAISDSASPPFSAPMPRGAKLFTSAIRSSLESTLLVCAYVVFFSALTGVFGLVLEQIHCPDACKAFLSSFLELSGGMRHASFLENTFLGVILSAFGAGWSGLSVHCQVLSLCDGRGLSFRSYFLAKAGGGILCALLFGVGVCLLRWV